MVNEFVLLAIGIGLIAYNNLANLSERFQKTSVYVTANILFGSVLVILAERALGSNTISGLTDNLQIEFAAIGLSAGVAAGLPIMVVGRFSPSFVADTRLQGSTKREITLRSLIRIPLGTALLEEVAFRGVLFSALLPYGVVPAALMSSLTFALWHVVPSLDMVRSNRIETKLVEQVGGVAVGLVLTFIAGLFLVWLKVITDSLLTPFLFHAALNSTSTLWSFLAGRRLRADSGPA